jgi:hypothetical protein
LNTGGLWDFVENEAGKHRCSFCRRNVDSVDIDIIAKHMRETIEAHWNEPENTPYESAEGGYQWRVDDASNLIRYNLLDRCDKADLVDDICKIVDDGTLYDTSGFFSDNRLYHWNSFCEYVQHERRYILYLKADGESHETEFGDPLVLLKDIADTLRAFDLVRHAQAYELSLFRARSFQTPFNLNDLDESGPPPLSLCTQTNRLSPPGIPALYCSENVKTAMAEIDAKPDDKISVFQIKNIKDLRYLNLCDLPPVTSIFDYENAGARKNELFIEDFTKQLSCPIVRDERVHVEYIPTQLAAEFLRVLLDLDAIRFPSSVGVGANWAFFVYSQRDKDNIYFDGMKFYSDHFDLEKTELISVRGMPSGT